MKNTTIIKGKNGENCRCYYIKRHISDFVKLNFTAKIYGSW